MNLISRRIASRGNGPIVYRALCVRIGRITLRFVLKQRGSHKPLFLWVYTLVLALSAVGVVPVVLWAAFANGRVIVAVPALLLWLVCAHWWYYVLPTFFTVTRNAQ